MMDTKVPVSRRALLGGVAAAATVSAFGLPTPAEAAPVLGGKMIYARYADSQRLDPVFTELNVDIWVMNNLFDTLLLPTPDGKGLKEGLATKWELSDGGKTVTLTVREGVKFADGTPMTMADVKFSLERAMNPKNGSWNSMVASVASVEVTEPATVVLKLKHPDPTLLAALAMFNTSVLPKAMYDKIPGKDDDEKGKIFGQKPMGTGAFYVSDWKIGEVMWLKKNPYYWKKDAAGVQLPYLDEVEMPVIPDDATRLLKLKAGEVHGTEFIPYARVKELQGDANLRMELWLSTKVTYIQFNCRPEYKGKPNPLSNVKVRQALNYAVNKDAIIAITTHGLGKPLSSFMSSVTPLHTGSGPVYPYDPAKAKALLAEAGFAKGLEITCHALSGNQDDQNNLTTIQQMLAQVGVRFTIEQMDNASRVAAYPKSDFQSRTAYWTDDIADPSEITSNFVYSPTVDCLHTGWKSEEADKLFVASQEEVDPAKRAAEYAKMQDIFNHTGPTMPLYETPYPVAFRKNAKGFVQIPLGNNYFEAAYVEK